MSISFYAHRSCRVQEFKGKFWLKADVAPEIDLAIFLEPQEAYRLGEELKTVAVRHGAVVSGPEKFAEEFTAAIEDIARTGNERLPLVADGDSR